ncbi:MAG: glycosyltransferase [Motilibacteraceae bacterium]
MTPARVLWLTKGLGRGGAEQILASSAGLLDPHRYQVEVAYTLGRKDALVPRLRADGVTVHALGDGRVPLWPQRLERLLARERYDLVHTHAPVPASAARLVVPRRSVVVHTEHNMWDRYRSATRWANATTYKRNDAVIAVSTSVAESIDRNRVRAGSPLHVLRHGIDVRAVAHGADARGQARKLLGLPVDAPVIGCVANFTPKKDHATLVRAHATVPDAHLVLVGLGPLEADLRSQVAELGTQDRVHFLGMRDDVPALLAAFDVFCLSSRFEGLPLSLQEAMAAGAAPVVTSAGGMPELVADGVNGLIVEPGATAQLSDALSRVLADENLRQRLGEAAREASQDFSLDQTVRELERIYDGLLP